jgi:protocatechuate 3,4-dioxygenase beta subunit
MNRDTVVLFLWFLFLAGVGATATRHMVRGTVTTTDGAAIANASVVLRTEETGRAQYGTLTAGDGSFTLRDIANGRYRFAVQKDGYLQWAAQLKPRWPGANVILDFNDASEDREFHIQLTRASAISGRILDENGSPLIGSQVRIYKVSNFYGVRRFLPVIAPGTYVETNDLGEYRAYALPPGKYLVGASYSRRIVGPFKQLGVDESAPTDQYLPTFFPGVTDPAGATLIEIAPEMEARGVDFSVRRDAVARIRGHLTGCGSASSASITLRLRLAGISEPLLQLQGRMVNAAGDFEISSVPRGSYDLQAYGNAPNRSSTALISIEVGAEDINNMLVKCPERVAIHGTVRVDATTNLSGLPRISLQSVDIPGSGYGTVVKRDGTFALQDFLPGRYRIQVEGLPDIFFLRSAKLGTRDVLEDGIIIEGALSDSLDIVLSDKAAVLNGIVRDDDQKPVTGALVVIIPAADHRGRDDLYVVASTADNGTFKMRRLTPGDYELYAWPYADAIDNYRDPDFIRKYMTRGTSLHLEPGAISNINLPLLP